MLTALKGQAGIRQHDYEILIVDGGSTDGTREIVTQFEGVILLTELRRGPGIARDTGLRQAKGEIICHLDADATPTRRWLASLLKPFADPRITIVGGKSVSLPPRTAAQRYMARSGRIDAVEYVERPIFPFVPSRNMAVRRETAIAVGGWTEECITGEDVDFCHRVLKQHPASMVYQPDAILFHRDRETGDGLARQAWSYGEGTAQLYIRYPHETRWRFRDTVHVARQLVGRTMSAAALGSARKLGLVSADAAEHAYHHWLWSQSFWRGFYSFRRVRQYR